LFVKDEEQKERRERCLHTSRHPALHQKTSPKIWTTKNQHQHNYLLFFFFIEFVSMLQLQKPPRNVMPAKLANNTCDIKSLAISPNLEPDFKNMIM
jgi:hypothetical protein